MPHRASSTGLPRRDRRVGDAAAASQAARNLAMDLVETGSQARFVIRDRDRNARSAPAGTNSSIEHSSGTRLISSTASGGTHQESKLTPKHCQFRAEATTASRRARQPPASVGMAARRTTRTRAFVPGIAARPRVGARRPIRPVSRTTRPRKPGLVCDDRAVQVETGLHSRSNAAC